MSSGIATAKNLRAPVRAGELSPWVFVFMAALFLVTALAGFIPDSLRKIDLVAAGQRPPFPVIMHVHAVLSGTWLVLLFGQSLLAATGRNALHRQLGMLSFALVPAIVLAIVLLIYEIGTDFGKGFAMMPAEMAGPVKALITGIFMEQIRMVFGFAIFVGWALAVRKSDPGMHKRLMILGTLYPLLAGIDRLTWIPKDGPIDRATLFDLSLIAWALPMLVCDLVQTRRIHSAYLVWGAYGLVTAIPIHLYWGDPEWVRMSGSWFGWPA
jgi:hypothetical protein